MKAVICGFLFIVAAMSVACGLLYLAARDRAEERDAALDDRDQAVREAGRNRAEWMAAEQQLADCRAQLVLTQVAAILAAPDQEA